jgi:hypothetical protein
MYQNQNTFKRAKKGVGCQKLPKKIRDFLFFWSFESMVIMASY